MMRLHGYWRSGAAWRVRIAMALKRLDCEQVAHDLRVGDHYNPDYASINPQQLVPALEADGLELTQSPAILEWLEETHPYPALLPADPAHRAIVRAMAMIVCCDIHPLNNLRVLGALREDHAVEECGVRAWIGRWIEDGFAALEPMIASHGGRFAFGHAPTIADCCLVPQVYAARRFGVAMERYPRLTAVTSYCGNMEAFISSHPLAQPDAD